jgi:hypothetical protein
MQHGQPIIKTCYDGFDLMTIVLDWSHPLRQQLTGNTRCITVLFPSLLLSFLPYFIFSRFPSSLLSFLFLPCLSFSFISCLLFWLFLISSFISLLYPTVLFLVSSHFPFTYFPHTHTHTHTRRPFVTSLGLKFFLFDVFLSPHKSNLLVLYCTRRFHTSHL